MALPYVEMALENWYIEDGSAKKANLFNLLMINNFVKQEFYSAFDHARHVLESIPRLNEIMYPSGLDSKKVIQRAFKLLSPLDAHRVRAHYYKSRRLQHLAEKETDILDFYLEALKG